ncbi:MAG: hypothetical protein Q9218_001816 [Villophora microphyllina]
MAEAAHQASNGAKPPLKRPLFAKPSWAQNNDLSNPTDFFRKSDQSYVNIAAEAERKRQRIVARKQRGEAREAKRAEPVKKRQRFSSDSDSDADSNASENDESSLLEPNEQHVGPKESLPKLENETESRTSNKLKFVLNSLSKTYETAITARKDEKDKQPSSSNIIELDDEDSAPEAEQDAVVKFTAVKRPEPLYDDDFPPSDDEFAELARQAREKARRKRLQTDILSPASDSQPSGLHDDHNSRFESTYEPTPPPEPPDPVVSILITSDIPDTEPLIVNRKISQRLKDVRLCWCRRQGFSEERTATVILTWRDNRMFDVATCKSLGIGVDCNGDIVMKGHKDVFGEEERQIHMKAMTEEMLGEQQRLKRLGNTEEDHRATVAQEEQPPQAEKKERQLRIILKAKGYTDFKLIVKPYPIQNTRISRIVNAFKLDKQLDNGREVFLSFDGERLAPETQVEETELDDMDYIDVYIK